MHTNVLEYLAEVKKKFPSHFHHSNVVEYGSMDMNGTPRKLFEDCAYVGVDWRSGPCVDVVSRMHEFVPFICPETVVTTSTMEHDAHLWKSMDRCWEILVSGGLFVGTTVNEKWAEHSPEAGEWNYYGGVDPKTLKEWIVSKDSHDYELRSNTGINESEIYFYMVKK